MQQEIDPKNGSVWEGSMKILSALSGTDYQKPSILRSFGHYVHYILSQSWPRRDWGKKRPTHRAGINFTLKFLQNIIILSAMQGWIHCCSILISLHSSQRMLWRRHYVCRKWQSELIATCTCNGVFGQTFFSFSWLFYPVFQDNLQGWDWNYFLLQANICWFQCKAIASPKILGQNLYLRIVTFVDTVILFN